MKKSALFLASALALGGLTLGGLAPLSPVHAEGRPVIGSYEDHVAIEQLMWDYVRAAMKDCNLLMFSQTISPMAV